tara:strand:+ start:446 stop:1438 length:993 start_codon:yes stop_codon:yes gene_type:complete
MADFDNRFVALKKESAYGTPAGSFVFGEVDDESIRHTYDLMTREDMSRYGSSKSVTGKEFSAGSVNMAMIGDEFTGNILMGMMGTDTVGSISGGFYPHTFTEAGTLASYTFLVSREDKEHLYKGCVIDSLSVSAALNEYASVSFNMMGKSEDIASLAAAGTTSPTFPDSLDPLYFSNAKVFFNGNATASDAVADISFDINLNRDGDNACALGSTTYVRAPPVQRREVTGTITFNKVVHSTSVAEPTYTQLTTQDGLEFAGSGVELKVQFGDDTTADLLTFNFYKIRFEAADANVSGRDTNTMSVNFVALFSSADSKMMDIVLRSTKSSSF